MKSNILLNMANLLFYRLLQSTSQRCHPKSLVPVVSTICSQHRHMTHYPIDDVVGGLTDEQIQVIRTLNFCDKFSNGFPFSTLVKENCF